MFAEKQAFKDIELKITLLDEQILITDKFAKTNGAGGHIVPTLFSNSFVFNKLSHKTLLDMIVPYDGLV